MITDANTQTVKTVGKLMELSDDERNRMLHEAREMERRDNAARLKVAREEGYKEGLEESRREQVLKITRNLLATDLSDDAIAIATGLSPEEINALRESK